jgi:4-hydroxy 2-oxovalerate aldolase
MLLKILFKMKIKNAYLAGFDGYSADNSKNYPGEYIQFLYCNDDVVLRNEAVKKALGKIMENIKIKFLTPSLYV